MTHPGLEELVAKFREARREAEADMGNPEQLKSHRELAEACPAFTQNLLFLAWRLLRSDEPGRPLEDRLAEIQRLLELAVLGSYRSAPAVVELGELAERLFPDHTPLMLEVLTTREYARLDGLLAPGPDAR